MTDNEYTPHPLEVALAKQIRVELTEHDMSQTQLAENIGIGRVTLSRYLNGHRTFDYSQVISIAAAFGLEASELIRRAESRLSE